MKNLLILSMMLFSLTAGAFNVSINTDSIKAGIINTISEQVKDSLLKATPDTNNLSMKQVYNDAKEGIAGLAKALKVPAEHVYGVLVKQQVVIAIAWLIGCLIIIIFPFCFLGKMYSWATTYSEDSDGFSYFAFFVCIIAPIGIGLLVLVFHLNTIATGFVNPEYGAIQDIWNFVKH